MPDLSVYQVREKYAAVAASTLSGEHAVAQAFGYTPEELASIRAEANVGLSCGNPTATGVGHKPGELSVGQQWVALARTLANDPALILADEPTGNLDPQTREQVVGFLEEFRREGRTIVLVAHDPVLAGRAPRTLTLVNGGVLAAAGPA